jgi:glycosidase
MCPEVERRCPHEFTYAGMGGEQAVELRGDYRAGGWNSGDAMTFDGALWRVTVPTPYNVPVQYKLRVTKKDGTVLWLADPANSYKVPDGVGGMNSVVSGITCSAWTCASTQIVCAGSAATGGYDWRDAVMYFVFVDRFLDGDPSNNRPLAASGLGQAANWQGGDWAGVTQKIQAGYFGALGVNTLWLTVPVDASESTGVGDDGNLYSGYHGYWPRDLSQPETRFGSASELKALVAAAHQAGLKVILDYAMNHVHADSPTYKAHQSDGWFNPLLVNGQSCVCGTAVCPWDTAAKTCWFRDYLPDFNFNNAAARKFSVDNLLSWATGYGVDGFRLDAVKHIEVSWLTDARARLISDVEPSKKQHTYLVGETFTGDRALIKSFIDPCGKLDGQFDFPLRAALNQAVLVRQGKMQDLVSFMDSNTGYYGDAVMSTFVGNHDVPRAIHFAEDAPLWSDVWAGGKERAWTNQPAQPSASAPYERLALAMTVLETNRGVPLLYYGDEIGLAGAGDPDNRRMMPWSGYSAPQSWLYARMQKLGTLRAQHSALRRGDRTTISVDDDSWVYKMVDGSDTVYVALNRSDAARTLSGWPAAALTDGLTGDAVTGGSSSVPARGARILVP